MVNIILVFELNVWWMRVGNEVIEIWVVWVSNCKSVWSNVVR